MNANQRVSSLAIRDSEQMFPLRLTTPIPSHPIGKDLTSMGTAENGGFYYCKADDGSRSVPANELIMTRLARDLGLPTAEFSIISDERGALSFGSLKHPSTADAEAVKSFFLRPSRNELGGPDRTKAVFISRLFALDMFIGNADRAVNNHVSISEGGFQRIAPIDFADATIFRTPEAAFPSSKSKTVQWGRVLDHTHGFEHEAAEEMLTRIEAVPVGFFEPLLERMPTEWATSDLKQRFLEFWGGTGRKRRLVQLGAGLKDGSLR